MQSGSKRIAWCHIRVHPQRIGCKAEAVEPTGDQAKPCGLPMARCRCARSSTDLRANWGMLARRGHRLGHALSACRAAAPPYVTEWGLLGARPQAELLRFLELAQLPPGMHLSCSLQHMAGRHRPRQRTWPWRPRCAGSAACSPLPSPWAAASPPTRRPERASPSGLPLPLRRRPCAPHCAPCFGTRHADAHNSRRARPAGIGLVIYHCTLFTTKKADLMALRRLNSPISTGKALQSQPSRHIQRAFGTTLPIVLCGASQGKLHGRLPCAAPVEDGAELAGVLLQLA